MNDVILMTVWPIVLMLLWAAENVRELDELHLLWHLSSGNRMRPNSHATRKSRARKIFVAGVR